MNYYVIRWKYLNKFGFSQSDEKIFFENEKVLLHRLLLALDGDKRVQEISISKF